MWQMQIVLPCPPAFFFCATTQTAQTTTTTSLPAFFFLVCVFLACPVYLHVKKKIYITAGMWQMQLMLHNSLPAYIFFFAPLHNMPKQSR